MDDRQVRNGVQSGAYHQEVCVNVVQLPFGVRIVDLHTVETMFEPAFRQGSGFQGMLDILYIGRTRMYI